MEVIEMQKEVMKMAVKLAKKMEGDWTARMALALKTAWKIVREGSAMKIVESSAKEWKNYGKHRLYIRGRLLVTVSNWGNPVVRKTDFEGYYDFDRKVFVRQGGKDNFRKEIFRALEIVAAEKGAVA